ncbi:MAG: hypothetical protein COT73_04830 [Bdellovibrio sp. CG10_big_fil_rev_8_21_14_0_10_47_8]|nr:MAG: hypothetical protein COT73_04830 [Bdellovibrio sp. CG10_big_fil_rev_8_21_14_0_10_47_8]
MKKLISPMIALAFVLISAQSHASFSGSTACNHKQGGTLHDKTAYAAPAQDRNQPSVKGQGADSVRK